MNHIKRMTPIFLIITSILGLCHYFIYLTITRSLPADSNLKWGIALLLTIGLFSTPLGLALSMTSLKKKFQLLSWFGYIWLGFFNFLFFSSLLEWLTTIFFEHNYSYWSFFASLLILAWALLRGLSAPRLIHHELKGPPAMQGLRLVQVSDLHVGLLHLNANWLAQVVAQVNSFKPDIFAITGDLVEGPFDEVSPMLQVLDTAVAKIEKFYITGNHEYIHGSGPWEKRLEQLGYTTLHNQNKIVHYRNAKVLLAGVPDRMVPRFDPHLTSQPDVALRTNEKVDYRILLAHEPASRWDIKTEPCDLILSGHTHGGQIFPFGAFVRIVQPVVAGFKQMGSVLVFAHQGTGLWGPPMRWFSRSEVVLFTWV